MRSADDSFSSVNEISLKKTHVLKYPSHDDIAYAYVKIGYDHYVINEKRKAPIS